MIFDIDDCFIESDKWVFYEQNPEDEPDGTPKAYLDIYKVSGVFLHNEEFLCKEKEEIYLIFYKLRLSYY